MAKQPDQEEQIEYQLTIPTKEREAFEFYDQTLLEIQLDVDALFNPKIKQEEKLAILAKYSLFLDGQFNSFSNLADLKIEDEDGYSYEDEDEDGYSYEDENEEIRPLSEYRGEAWGRLQVEERRLRMLILLMFSNSPDHSDNIRNTAQEKVLDLLRSLNIFVENIPLGIDGM